MAINNLPIITIESYKTYVDEKHIEIIRKFQQTLIASHTHKSHK